MEDKMIRAKIDSLHTLPEGYAPSLDSKWELLQAGLEGKKEKYPLYWIAIAAGLLLAMGLGWVMIKGDIKNEAPAVVKNENKEMVAPAVEAPAERTIPVEEAVSSNNNKKPLDKNSFVVIPQQKEQQKNENTIVENTDTVNETMINTVPAIVKSTARPKKKKFVEMEFSDPPQDNPSMEAQADARIRIRFMPPQEQGSQGNNESASIKLKKSF